MTWLDDLVAPDALAEMKSMATMRNLSSCNRGEIVTLAHAIQNFHAESNTDRHVLSEALSRKTPLGELYSAVLVKFTADSYLTHIDKRALSTSAKRISEAKNSANSGERKLAESFEAAIAASFDAAPKSQKSR